MKLRHILPALCLVPPLAHAQPAPEPAHRATVSALVITAMAQNLADALNDNAALERRVRDLQAELEKARAETARNPIPGGR